MATYAVGDIQGCFATFRRLLHRLQFEPERDRLIAVGDVVNRGPDSLGVLRWLRAHAKAVHVVLGNHDLHMLGRYYGVADPKKKDTLQAVLSAPEAAELVDWMRSWPLLWQHGSHVCVHAGLLPGWDIATAARLAREAEAELQGDNPAAAVAAMLTPPEPIKWDAQLAGTRRLGVIAQGFTRTRTCRPDGALCSGFSGPPEQAPQGCRPWYAMRPVTDDRVLVFGHWSTHGLQVLPQRLALDTGCVWGGQLTAVRLEDHAVFGVQSMQ